MNKLFSILALPLLLLAGLSGCGGGGEASGSAADSISGTAAQYFNKNAVGLGTKNVSERRDFGGSQRAGVD